MCFLEIAFRGLTIGEKRTIRVWIMKVNKNIIVCLSEMLVDVVSEVSFDFLEKQKLTLVHRDQFQ